MKIARWNELYENAVSRKIKHLRWVAVTNKQDGERYSELMESEFAAEIFTAWILMLQIASRSTVRGSLRRDDGTPHNAASLARKTRGKAEWFETAIPFLLRLGWLAQESNTGEPPGTPGEPPGTPGEPPGTPGEPPGTPGLKGREGKGTRQRRPATERQLKALAEVVRPRSFGNGKV